MAAGILGQALSSPSATNTSLTRDWGKNPEVAKQVAANTGYTGDFGGGQYGAWVAQQNASGKPVNEGTINRTTNAAPSVIPGASAVPPAPSAATGISSPAPTISDKTPNMVGGVIQGQGGQSPTGLGTGILGQSTQTSQNRDWGKQPELAKQIAANTGYTENFGNGQYGNWVGQQNAAGKPVNEGVLNRTTTATPSVMPIQVPQPDAGQAPALYTNNLNQTNNAQPVLSSQSAQNNQAKSPGLGEINMSGVVAPTDLFVDQLRKRYGFNGDPATWSDWFNANQSKLGITNNDLVQMATLAKQAGQQSPQNPNRNWGENPDKAKQIAAMTGYSGDFGNGQYAAWKASEIAAGRSVNEQGVGATPIATERNWGANPDKAKQIAAATGYQGNFGDGQYAAWKASEIAAGRPVNEQGIGEKHGLGAAPNPLTDGRGTGTIDATNPPINPNAPIPGASTYQAQQLGNPNEWNVTGQQTAAGQLEQLLRSDSPYLQQARSRAMQAANGRGLLNSSLAATAGESAAYDAAIPLAQTDAATYAKSASYNADMGNQFAVQNAGFQNAAGQFNAGAQNTLVGQRLGAETSRYTADVSAKTQMAQAALDAKTRMDLGNLSSQTTIATNNATITSQQYQQARDILSREGMNTANLSNAQVLAGINNLSSQQIAGMNNQSAQAVAQIQAQVSAANAAAQNSTTLAANAANNAASAANTAATNKQSGENTAANNKASSEANAANNLVAKQKSYTETMASLQSQMLTRIANTIQNNPNLTKEQKAAAIKSEHEGLQATAKTMFVASQLPGNYIDYQFVDPEPATPTAPESAPTTPAQPIDNGGNGGN